MSHQFYKPAKSRLQRSELAVPGSSPKMFEKALNSNADYIIQIDGDCILDKFFIKDHLHSVRENTYLFGSRVNINASYLDKLFLHKKTKFNYFSRGLSKRNRLIRIPLLGTLLYKPKLIVCILHLMSELNL